MGFSDGRELGGNEVRGRVLDVSGIEDRHCVALEPSMMGLTRVLYIRVPYFRKL